MMEALSQFHFLRPLWLTALALLVPLVWIGVRSRRAGGAWRNVCDPHLLQHLLTDQGGRTRHWPVALMALAWTATSFALAGPTWERLPQPAFRTPEQRVLALNLSASMNATDVEPSRLARARFELGDALEGVGDGQVGLVIFSEEPYVVTPISDDPRVVAEFIPVLETNLMPGSGARVDRAITEAQALLEQSGAASGGIVLLTDSAGERPELAVAAARSAAAAGFEVSVLAIGTEAGAPIPLRRGFMRDAAGQTVMAKLDVASLEAIARAGDGRFERVRADDGDIESVLAMGTMDFDPSAKFEASGVTADSWRDMGFLLVWLVAILAPLAFRRGWAGALAFAVCVGGGLLPAAPARADLSDWFQRPDQQAAIAFEAGRHAEAAERFEDPNWRAASLYRAGEFESAAELLTENDDIAGQYNLGNSLAQSGDLEAAIAAYDRVLEREAAHEDAKFNRDLVEQLLKQQQQQQDQQGEGSESEDDSQSGESSSDDSSQATNSEDQQSDGESGDGNPRPGQDDAGENTPEQAESGAESDPSEARNGENGNPDDAADPAHESETAAAQPGDDRDEPADDSARAGEPDPTDEPGEEGSEAGSDMASQPLSERDQAVEQWLDRVSDDPGGLLREKLRRKYAEKRYRDSIRGSNR